MCELQGLCNAGEVRPPASQRPLVNPLMRFLALPTVRSCYRRNSLTTTVV